MRKYRLLMYLFLFLTLADLYFGQEIVTLFSKDVQLWTFFFTAVPTTIFWALGLREAEKEKLFREEIESD